MLRASCCSAEARGEAAILRRTVLLILHTLAAHHTDQELRKVLDGALDRPLPEAEPPDSPTPYTPPAVVTFTTTNILVFGSLTQ
jgi:hypothetical protein